MSPTLMDDIEVVKFVLARLIKGSSFVEQLLIACCTGCGVVGRISSLNAGGTNLSYCSRRSFCFFVSSFGKPFVAYDCRLLNKSINAVPGFVTVSLELQCSSLQ